MDWPYIKSSIEKCYEVYYEHLLFGSVTWLWKTGVLLWTHPPCAMELWWHPVKHLSVTWFAGPGNVQEASSFSFRSLSHKPKSEKGGKIWKWSISLHLSTSYAVLAKVLFTLIFYYQSLNDHSHFFLSLPQITNRKYSDNIGHRWMIHQLVHYCRYLINHTVHRKTHISWCKDNAYTT